MDKIQKNTFVDFISPLVLASAAINKVQQLATNFPLLQLNAVAKFANLAKSDAVKQMNLADTN